MSPNGYFTNPDQPALARWAVAALLILLFTSTSCTRRSASAGNVGDLDIQLDAESQSIGRTSLTIRITDESGETVNGALVTVRGDMSHAGMTPVLAEAQETDPGLYRAEIEWTMAGDWNVSVSVDRSGYDLVQQQFDLSIAGPGG